MLRAGVIGLGVGERHAAAYDTHAGADLVALCDLDPDQLQRVGQRFPAARLFEDAATMIDDPAIDVISVASWDDHHFAQVSRALSAGKHVFVEKPICESENQIEELKRLCEARPHLAFSSNLVLRASPRFVELREMIRSDALGRPYYVEADYNYGRIHKLTDGWRGRIPSYSVVLGGAIHMVDLLLWLTGERVVEVQALGNSVCTRDSSFEGDDFVVALLRFEEGLIAKVTANFGCVMPHFHGLVVYGDQGTFVNDIPDARLYSSRDPGVPFRSLSTAYPGVDKGVLLGGFIDALAADRPAPVTATEVFASMDVCLAIDRSRATGHTVSVSHD